MCGKRGFEFHFPNNTAKQYWEESGFDRVKCSDEFERMHRLGQYIEFVTSTPSIVEQGAGVVVARDQKYLALGKELADLNRSLDAIHLRHHDTSHQEFKRKAPGKCDACFAAVYSTSFKPTGIQDQGECVCYCFIVIDDESVRRSLVALCEQRKL